MEQFIIDDYSIIPNLHLPLFSISFLHANTQIVESSNRDFWGFSQTLAQMGTCPPITTNASLARVIAT